jgi:malate dehydrogenase (quinone)
LIKIQIMADNDVMPPCDAILIGAGVMSATLGVFLKELEPNWKIEVFERLDKVAAESSDAWNNAGTGHSGLCELNYSPQMPDGSVDVSKAEHIVEMFEISKQFWSYLVAQGFFDSPRSFINSCAHMSLVWGDANVDYLKKRYEAMRQNHLFKGITYSDNPQQLTDWVPLIMEGRHPNQKIAATRSTLGTDVNFGALTRSLFNHLKGQHGVEVNLKHEVHHLHQQSNGQWLVKIKDLATGHEKTCTAGFVFIGAGGGALPLLEKSGIAEGKGFGGFPVSGEWLRCTDKAVIERHHAKVYGKAAVGSPPMSVPHLDTRVIDGEKALLFGPYAGFSTRFLKEGSYLDLPRSIHLDNILSILGAGAGNIALTEYLVKQVTQSAEERFSALQEFFPMAKMEDWELVVAGQRVQVIKKDAKHLGVLEFGTEIISHADGSIAALLGASPGASTSVYIMLDLLGRCFKEKMNGTTWQNRLKEMIPTYEKKLGDDEKLCEQTRARTSQVLQLN